MGGNRNGLFLGLTAAVVPLVVLMVFLFGKRTPAIVPAAKPSPAKTEGAVLDLKIPADRSIAVLPFTGPPAADSGLAHLVEGAQASVLELLSMVREFRILSHGTVADYRGSKAPPSDLGRGLNTAYLVRGAVSKADTTLKLSIQLIDSGPGTARWSREYTPRADSPEELSMTFSSIAIEIADALKTALSAEEKALIERKLTANGAAYDAYLKAREAVAARKPSLAALELLESAVAADPNFADAWVEIAELNLREYASYADRTRGRLERAKAAADAAVRLAPDSPAARGALGHYYLHGAADFAKARDELEKAAATRPNYSVSYRDLAILREREGKWADAIALHRIAAAFDPANMEVTEETVRLFKAGRRYAEALVERRALSDHLKASGRLTNEIIAMEDTFGQAYIFYQAVGSIRDGEILLARLSPEQLSSPEGMSIRRQWHSMTGDYAAVRRLDAVLSLEGQRSVLPAAFVFAALGKSDEGRPDVEAAAAQLRSRVAAEPENDVAWAMLGMAEALLGRKTEAIAAAERARELQPESRDHMLGPLRSYNAALVYAWCGDTEKAVTEIARLLAVPNGTPGVHIMRKSPETFPLHGDVLFKGLLAEPKNNEELF